jgi:hypothetical protein
MTEIEIFFRSGKSVLLDFLKTESKGIAKSIQKRGVRKATIVQCVPPAEFVHQFRIAQNWASDRSQTSTI